MSQRCEGGTVEVIRAITPATNAQPGRTTGGVTRHGCYAQGDVFEVRLSGLGALQLHDAALALRRGAVPSMPRAQVSFGAPNPRIGSPM